MSNIVCSKARGLVTALIAVFISVWVAAAQDTAGDTASGTKTSGALIGNLGSTGPLTCQSWNESKTTCFIRAWLRVGNDKNANIEAPQMVLYDRHLNRIPAARVESTPPLPARADKGSLVFLDLQFKLPEPFRYEQMPLRGSFILGGRPRDLLLTAPLPSPYLFWVFSIAGGLAFLTVSIAAFWIGWPTLKHRMGAPVWKASESWSSNVTVGGAVVNGFLAVGAMSNPVISDKTGYVVLGLLFGVFVGFAPFVYNLFRRPISALPADATDAQKRAEAAGVIKKQYEGYVLLFLFAGFLTLWGSFGQLGLFAVVVRELYLMDVLANGIEMAVAAIVAVLAILLLIYGVDSLHRAATMKSNPGASAAKPAQEGYAPAPRKVQEWSLL